MLIPCLAHIEDVKIRGWPRAQPVPPKNHDAGLVNVLAPWRNAAIAAELLSRQSSMCTTSNHTNPSSPYVRMPANRSAIFAGWPAEGAAPVSARSIGSRVISPTATMVGPNKEIGEERRGGKE